MAHVLGSVDGVHALSRVVLEFVVLDPGFEEVVEHHAKRVVDDPPPNVRNVGDEMKNKGESDAALHQVDVGQEQITSGSNDSVENQVRPLRVAENSEVVHDVAHEGNQDELEVHNRFEDLVGFG